tara:strand:- start:3879 stop:4421 length:543 start_codon:yes stop_codon:yes gene_type:complete
MPNYDDVNTSLEDLKSGYDMPEAVKGTLFEYDESGDNNLWGSFSGNKSLIQDNLKMNQQQAVGQTGVGLAGMGQRQQVQNTLSDNANQQVGAELDNTMYGQYKNKNKWMDEQMGTIADSILAGDTTVNTSGDTGGDTGGPGGSNPSGYTGSPTFGDEHIDNDGVAWIFGSMGWREVDEGG